MSQIRDRHVDLSDQIKDMMHERAKGDAQVRDLVKSVQKDRARLAELAKVEVKVLEPATQQMLGQTLARELRGQLPPQIARALEGGSAGSDLLQNLLGRFGHGRPPQATSPEAARAQAADTSMPQQALRWTQFVQRAQHVPGSQLQGRAGSAAPKGEGTSLAELIGQRARGVLGPGLRSPQLVARNMADLSPQQRELLMKATFGDGLAKLLGGLGIGDPLSFVKAGALPHDRAALAEALGMGRGELLGLLMKAELLKIGPGKNGELGIRPDLLGPLKDAGIAMLGTLAAARILTREEMAAIYGLLRLSAGGFAKTMKGSRPPVKRDLLHWARQAGRRPSDILLAEWDEERHLAKGDAQELIAAWYLENLWWDTLAAAKERVRHEYDRRERERRESQREHERREGERKREEDERRECELLGPEMEYDSQRQDELMCFWITDFNTNPALPQSMRRMYVCIDPRTGAIIPQQVEADVLPSSL